MLSVQTYGFHALPKEKQKATSYQESPEDRRAFWPKWLKNNESFITINREVQQSGQMRWQVVMLKKGIDGKIEVEGLLSLEWKDRLVAERSAQKIAQILEKKYTPYNQKFRAIEFL